MSELDTESLMTDYFLGDALGSARQLTDSNGAVTSRWSSSSRPGAGRTSYGFTGEYQDSHNDLLYLRARHYAPGTGRFLTRDTWPGDHRRPRSLNRWVHVEGNPVNFVDPSGHIKEGREARRADLIVAELHKVYFATVHLR